jgi:hypothetical protein
MKQRTGADVRHTSSCKKGEISKVCRRNHAGCNPGISRRILAELLSLVAVQRHLAPVRAVLHNPDPRTCPAPLPACRNRCAGCERVTVIVNLGKAARMLHDVVPKACS